VPGTPVDLRRKVVLAIDTFGSRVGNFWVGEEAGGAFSGVLVFGAPVEQVAQLAVGDLVDITGAEKTEFALAADTSGRTTTELQPLSGGAMTVTKVGTGTVPATQVVDALSIAMMDQAARDAEWEKWEGVLVRVDNVAALNDVRYIRSSTGADDCTFREFEVAGGVRVDSSLAPIPGSPPANDECMETGTDNLVDRGDCLASVSGIGDYFFNHKILPRMTSEIATGGSGCVVENTMALCMDTLDNDGNGFTDCEDFSCSAFCAVSTTVEMVQSGTATGVVTLENLVVTAIDDVGTSKGFWVQQNPQAAANQGVLVFTGSTTPTVTVGQRVNVTGSVVEFDVMPPMGDTLTEISFPTVTPATGTATPLPLSGVAINTLKDITAVGEPYESVLVQLTNVRVSAHPGNDRLTLTDGTNTIVADDDSFNYAMTDYPIGTCFASVTGVMGVNLFDNERRIFPRSAADLVAGSSCP
jgi:hypothetical protein